MATITGKKLPKRSLLRSTTRHLCRSISFLTGGTLRRAVTIRAWWATGEKVGWQTYNRTMRSLMKSVVELTSEPWDID